MIEIWKDIPGYEELYAVSSYSRVKSYEKTRVMNNGAIRVYPERILKPKRLKCYLRVSLFKFGKRNLQLVHRLVAEAFIPNPNNLPLVCHKDDNPTNNLPDNLFWGTQKDNVEDCQRKGRHAKPKRPVIAILPDGSKKYQFESESEAARQTGITHRHISMCCRGKGKSAGGLIWSYAD
jgi:hypothetical protein